MILVTGAGGFVGRHLAELCAEHGAALTGIGRRAERPDLPEAAAYESLDLADADALSRLVAELRPEYVFHLAAEASVARSWKEPADVVRANVGSSLNLLEAVRRGAPEAVVLVACSGEEYGIPDRLPVDESHALRPRNPYAASKAMVDVLAGSYADAHGLHVARTRAFNHCGPGQSDTYVVSTFARQIAEAELDPPADGRAVILTGNTEVRRDFCDVRDVARAYWALAVESRESGAFNVCSGRPTAVSDILDTLAAHTALEVDCRTDPSRLRDNEVMEIRGSHEKLTGATGWRPEIGLSETLRDTLDWWRERVRGGEAR